ncbi:uncharacterized protein LY89DRAFT_381948 [Mollisia scopiformis]|uniref:Uncharacterized protein n=1 Tax=Mollisia scopiformis TaxID=149040 RepID=A0A194XNJ4_MOLSC|nr:uncharacterized protein LY89DRAFT_381948 [Mollisia scopiformis]KUJ21733.1 hypothetical protein LY89DRAFT_381948 [Mollisia scopiformis]
MEQDFPIGVNLGPSHITSSYLNVGNNVVNVVSIESEQAWNELFLDTLRVKRDYEEKKTHANENCVKETIVSTLAQIQKATEEKLGRPAQIKVIGYPEHFKSTPYVSTLARIAIREYPEVTTPYQVRPYLDCVRMAYGLNTSEALGYGLSLDLDEYNSLLLHVDYQKDFLEVSIMSVTEHVDNRERILCIDKFGGSGNDKSATSEELAELKDRFQKLLEEQIRDNQYCQTQPEDFRLIIFSGSAPASEFQRIREAIVEIVPNFSERFRDEIDPFWVGARGAAQNAREYTINPPVKRIGHWTEEEFYKSLDDQCAPDDVDGHEL